MKKHLILLISLICVAAVIHAQTTKPFLIQYKSGEKALINLPPSSKVVHNKDYIEITPYGYALRFQNHNIKKQGFVTQQYVADSLTAKTVQVNCDNDKVTLVNPQNRGYSMIYDKNFHQVICYLPEEAQEIEFIPSAQRGSLYWLSNGKILVGVNTQNTK